MTNRRHTLLAAAALAATALTGCQLPGRDNTSSSHITITTDTPSGVPGATSPSTARTLGNLANLPISREHRAGYDRELFNHWIDADGDSCDTRQEVLARDSRTLPQIDAYACRVVAGDWTSPYDGANWTDPSNIDIDHVVALAEAWDSGAWSWPAEKRTEYANSLDDPNHLLAVTDTVNQQKSDHDPAEWMPTVLEYRCQYLADWVRIKLTWQLSVDQAEHDYIRSTLLNECKNATFAP